MDLLHIVSSMWGPPRETRVLRQVSGLLPPPGLASWASGSKAASVILNAAGLRPRAPPNTSCGEACPYSSSGETLRPRELVWRRTLSSSPRGWLAGLGRVGGVSAGESGLRGSGDQKLAWRCSAQRWAWPRRHMHIMCRHTWPPAGCPAWTGGWSVWAPALGFWRGRCTRLSAVAPRGAPVGAHGLGREACVCA